MKTIRIKLNEDNICIGISARLKRTTNNQKVMEADYQINEYPEDFMSNMSKYIITELEGELTFTVRPSYDDYLLYLESFDYGEDMENIPDSYEDWLASQ